MPDKSFHFSIPFGTGHVRTYPVVPVVLINQHTGEGTHTQLLFDTGATDIFLHPDAADDLGISQWRTGTATNIDVVDNVPANGYAHRIRMRVFGRLYPCVAYIIEMPVISDVYIGLLGRLPVLRHFDFGYFETEQRLYVARRV